MLGSLLFYKVLFCKGIKKWKKKCIKVFYFYYEGILGFGADMCVYKMHTIALCLEFEEKKNKIIFYAFYDRKLMIFWRKSDIHCGQNCAVGSGASCCLTHDKMFIFWHKER